jgi:hypothetical protein
MPKRQELLNDAIRRKKTNQVRSGYEREIINILPTNLEVSRVYSGVAHTSKNTSSQGQVEIEVSTFEEALEIYMLPEFCPLPTSMVTMRREQDGFEPSVTFYPSALVKEQWRAEQEVELVYPLLFQMAPLPGEPGKKGVAKVYLEWFTRVNDKVIANVRVYVSDHKCRYEPRNGGEYKVAVGYPNGLTRVMKPTSTALPFVTVAWYDNEFDQNYTVSDLLREATHV